MMGLVTGPNTMDPACSQACRISVLIFVNAGVMGKIVCTRGLIGFWYACSLGHDVLRSRIYILTAITWRLAPPNKYWGGN